MRGSVLINFNEIYENRTNQSVEVIVNGKIRDRVWSDIDNLYTTYVYPGDVINISVYNTTLLTLNTIDVTRVDYTTDAEGSDFGIKEEYITGITGNVSTSITITASTRPDAYRFNYVVDVTTNAYVYYQMTRCGNNNIYNTIAYPYGTFQLGDRVVDPDVIHYISGGLTRTTNPGGTQYPAIRIPGTGCVGNVTFVFNYYWFNQSTTNSLITDLGIQNDPQTVITYFVQDYNSALDYGTVTYVKSTSDWVGTFNNFSPFAQICNQYVGILRQGIVSATLKKNGVTIGTYSEDYWDNDPLTVCLNETRYNVNCGTQTFAAGDLITIDFTDNFHV